MHVRPRRGALYMPASNARAIEKARELPADVVILDLEDAVAPEAKAEARERARAAVEAVPAEVMGWRGDAIEAECFAFLAVRVLRGLPISFPTTTGVPQPMTGGRIAKD